MEFPDTQGKLIRTARAERTQAQFAQVLSVDRSCLSRYEQGSLGAPTAVIDFCLSDLARRISVEAGQIWPIEQALVRARETVEELERLVPGSSTPAKTSQHKKVSKGVGS